MKKNKYWRRKQRNVPQSQRDSTSSKEPAAEMLSRGVVASC